MDHAAGTTIGDGLPSNVMDLPAHTPTRASEISRAYAAITNGADNVTTVLRR